MDGTGNAELLARICVLENQMERVLGNGQPGMVAKLENKVDQVAEAVADIRKVVDASKIRLLVFVIAIIIAVLGAGNGTVSLHALIEALK